MERDYKHYYFIIRGGFNAAALGVPSGAELVIEESSTGTLEATGGHDAAGIGGGRNGGIGISSGTITINGGTITAICNSGWATGIGGGNGGSGGTTTINGGTITAISGKRYGAGIGGGAYGSGGTVIINGGTVTAEGYYGIGSGDAAGGGTLIITGGNISGTYNIVPTDGNNEVSCYTCKFIGDSEDMAGKTVTAITLENGGTYGLKDVVTFDGGSENEGYFNCYLPAGSKITSITVDGTTYICRGEDGTCYVDHYDWVDATCQKPEHCSVCELTRGDVIDHDWVDATCQKPEHCSVCELTRGDVIEHDYVGGFCTMCLGYNSDVVVIDSPEDLVAFANSVNAGNKSLGAVLDADIDMTGVAWTPICQTVSFHDAEATDTGYSGTFDGQGHTISNLTVTGISGGTYSYGLFGTVSGTVKNLGMVNYTYTMGSAPDARAGSIAGQVLTGGTITNCYSVGHTVTTNGNIAGGIAGCNYGGTISNCYALNGSVSGHDTRWGGVVGDCQKDSTAPDLAQTYGTVSNCYTDDTRVVSTQSGNATITNCELQEDTAFASGEIAYLLNCSLSENVAWYQTLETDTYPVLNSEHGTVYYGYTTELPCVVSYTNDKNSLLDQQGEHDWNEGVCTKCDAACTHSYVANGECLICGFVTELSVKLTDGGAFAEGEYTFADNIHTINTNKSVTISGTTTCERVFIAYGCDANIILAGVDINVSGIGYAYGIGIADDSTGDVTITLKEGTTNKISAGRRAAAVQKNVSNVASEEIGLLTIQGEGSLEANGGTDAAGIGGGYSHTSKITIAGGNITAKGLDYGTGIGASTRYKDCSYITISGGTITAIGGNNGLGLFDGIGYIISNGNSSNIFISGGSVKATDGISIRPRVSAENSASVYLLEIDNPEGRDITINGKDYPDFHGDEKKIYAYLPAGTAGNPNIVKFSGNTVGAYYYDGGWKTVTCADGHTESEDDGDCTTDITCEKCGYVITEGADAHTWENGECTNTNCDIVCEHISSTDDGDCTTAVICTVCGKVITEAEAEHIDSNDDGWCDVCDSGVAPESVDGYYQIANAGNLSWFAKFVSNGEKDANAVLLADIDMTGVAWTPICQTVSYNTTTATDTGYTGTFDGQGHTISNLTVTFNPDTSKTYSHGLFGTVSGTVKNLGMVDFKYENTTGDTRAGSIAGQVLTDGTITNCYSVGHSITTKSNIAGGIAGCNYGGTISNCYALNGSVSGYSTRWGGVVGDCKKDDKASDLAQTYGTVSNCYTDDTRVASTQNNSANITNCAVKDDAAFASGEVTYLLNGSSSENVTWYQTLKTDTYPVLDSKHGIVYSVFKCDGETPAGYSNENENKSHADENKDGYCDVCETIINGIGVNLAGHSVSLGGQIGMNFYMDLDDSVLADGEAHMLFTLPGEEEPVKVYVKNVKNSSVNIEGNTYYVFTCNVAAKDMAGTITAKIVRGDGSEGTEYTYSVREYAEALMQNNNATQEQKTLAKAMLNYGAYAQKYFDPNVAAGELANVNYPYEEGEFTVTTSGMKNYVPTVTDNSATLDYVGSTLILEADIKVRHYFKLKDGQTYSGNLTQYVAPQENPVDGTYYYYESAGITAANLGAMTDYEGVEGISISYCPLSYVTTVLANNNQELTDDTALQNLMKALYLYYGAVAACNQA